MDKTLEHGAMGGCGASDGSLFFFHDPDPPCVPNPGEAGCVVIARRSAAMEGWQTETRQGAMGTCLLGACTLVARVACDLTGGSPGRPFARPVCACGRDLKRRDYSE